MSHREHYTRGEGKDTWRIKGDKNVTGSTGKAEYNPDGSLKRLDVYTTGPSSSHGHTWLKQLEDGSYEFEYEEHDNH